MKKIKPFIEQSFFTVFNNAVLDQVMPELSPNAWKCLCLIIRKTIGWHKISDEISFSQIKEGTGIKSNHTIISALDDLVKNGYIIVHKSKGQWSTNKYILNLEFEISVPSAKNALEPSAKNALEPSAKNAHTKERVNKEKETPGPLTSSILTICQLDLEMMSRKSGKELTDLVAAFNRKNITADQIQDFNTWRQTHHWTGKDPATLKQIGDLWGQYEAWVKDGRQSQDNSNGKQSAWEKNIVFS